MSDAAATPSVAGEPTVAGGRTIIPAGILPERPKNIVYPPDAEKTTIADIFWSIAGLLNTSTWPEGTVRTILVIVILGGAVAGFWHGEQWELPQAMAALLPMTIGFVAALPTTSSLKSWVAIVLGINLIVMELVLGWSAPTLATSGIQIVSQYFAAKFLMTPVPQPESPPSPQGDM